MNLAEHLRVAGVIGGAIKPSRSAATESERFWYARVDSNHRPFAPEGFGEEA